MGRTAETLSPALPDAVEAQLQTVLRQLSDGKLTVGTAESCTGGLIASLLTDVPGLGHVFEAGFVVYSDEAKSRMLGIDPGLIDACGAVSAPVAAAMAEAVLARADIDIAVAVTGFAGAGADGEEPGLVYIACAMRGGETTCREHHFGDIGRGATRLACLKGAVGMIGEAVDAMAS